MEVKFKFERETKNTYRYQEDATEDAIVIGTLYIKKSAFAKKLDAITITIEES